MLMMTLFQLVLKKELIELPSQGNKPFALWGFFIVIFSFNRFMLTISFLWNLWHILPHCCCYLDVNPPKQLFILKFKREFYIYISNVHQVVLLRYPRIQENKHALDLKWPQLKRRFFFWTNNSMRLLYFLHHKLMKKLSNTLISFTCNSRKHRRI